MQFFFSTVTKMLWKIQGSPISCSPSHQSRGVKDGVEGLILFRWPPRWWMDRCGEGQREVREKAKGGTLSQVLDKSNGRSALHQALTDCCRGVMMNDCFTACWLDWISCFCCMWRERSSQTFVWEFMSIHWFSEGPADLGTVVIWGRVWNGAAVFEVVSQKKRRRKKQ